MTTKTLYQDASQPIQDRVRDLMARMTLEEKVAQLGSTWVDELQDGQAFSESKAAAWMKNGIGQIGRVGGASTLSPRANAEMTNAIQAYLVKHTRLGIPAIIHEECCNGYMALGATCFPQMAGLASTWMPELASAMTGVVRTQMRAVGAHQGLGPVLDVARDPRWGRVEETFGEDPTLTTQIGVAYVRGLQGPNLREGVMATAKHFLSHALAEGGLNCTPVHLGPIELRDVFLAPFEAVIRKAGLASIMNAYSELDQVVVAASRTLLTGLLRNELGFDGLVVSDYEAIMMLHTFHAIARDWAEAARLALNAGIDVELPSTLCYGDPLLEAVRSGQLEQALVDTAVSRLLTKKFELGLFEKPYVDVEQVASVFDTPQQRALARQIAQKSIVLLRNEGDLLPLPKTLSTLAVIGPNADEARHMLSDYSHQPQIELRVAVSPHAPSTLNYKLDAKGLLEGSVAIPTILDAIRQKVSPATQVLFARGCTVLGNDKTGFDEAVRAASQADAVVMVMGDRSGLVPGCTSGETCDRADLGLPGIQEELVQAVLAAGKPTVLVLVNGRPLAIPWIAEHVPALVEAWLPGEEGGAAVAEVLFGDVNPGGKLPMTFPRAVGQVPIYYNHKPSGGRSHWYGDYVALSTRPLFPFGHGLSYTRFEYANLHIEPSQVPPEGSVTIQFELKNAGERAGDEVVQLYVRDRFASIPRPVKELKGFKRVTLQPGQTRRLSFELQVDQLAFYDEALQLIVEPGTIQVMAGSSSDDIRLEGSFDIVGDQARRVPERVFSCQVTM
ncbi:MAG: glycoside hydrolase family 3 C-terminal domain-containing protein [Thermoflexales bacterium]|nr:glycoside hydrolase family 3 C-terminal domain-containing protein [Thermoflexales bacterium]